MVDTLQDIDGLDGPSWTQKVYIAFRIDGTNRAVLRTRAQSVKVQLVDFEIENSTELVQRATEIGVAEQNATVETDRQNRNKLRMKCRPDNDLDFDKLVSLVEDLLIDEPISEPESSVSVK